MLAHPVSFASDEWNANICPYRGSFTRNSTSSTISSSSTLVESLDAKTAFFEDAPKLEPFTIGSDLSIPSVTAPIRALLAQKLSTLSRPLRIVGLLATSDRGCHQYAKLTAKNCTTNGIIFEKRDISACRERPEDAGFEEVKQAIQTINEDEEVDGLIVYFPLFGPKRVSPASRKQETQY